MESDWGSPPKPAEFIQYAKWVVDLMDMEWTILSATRTLVLSPQTPQGPPQEARASWILQGSALL